VCCLVLNTSRLRWKDVDTKFRVALLLFVPVGTVGADKDGDRPVGGLGGELVLLSFVITLGDGGPLPVAVFTVTIDGPVRAELSCCWVCSCCVGLGEDAPGEDATTLLRESSLSERARGLNKSDWG